ncbi:hypothetical protein TNCV_938921 [Trichonephila clavipes]|nr:hypothetical protein TNCV_938921 [Trichonephila clavipes]
MKGKKHHMDLTGGCEKWLPTGPPELAKTLTGVYCRPRGLLRRWMCLGAGNYLEYGFLRLVPKSLGHTVYEQKISYFVNSVKVKLK